MITSYIVLLLVAAVAAGTIKEPKLKKYAFERDNLKIDESKQKIIEKESNYDEGYLMQPGFEKDIEYISNFNFNPINIENLQNSEELHGFSSIPVEGQIPFPTEYGSYMQKPNAYFIINYKNPILGKVYSSAVIPKPKKFIPTGILNFQSEYDNTQMYGYQNQPSEEIYSSRFKPQSILIDQGSTNEKLNDKNLESALLIIHNHPDIKSRLENYQKHQDNLDQQFDKKNFQNQQDLYVQQNPNNNFNDKSNLSSQKEYPVILLDPEGKLGLPFYPSFEIDLPPKVNETFDYEGIPLVDFQQNSNAQQAEDRIEDFPRPSGYTNETIWQAGDASAAYDNPILVRQLNETCAYIRFNETSSGTEDGYKPNIDNAGDYGAEREETELIRSVNITCDNYSPDVLSTFPSNSMIIDNCSQCTQKNNTNSNNSTNISNNEQEHDNGSELPSTHSNNGNIEFSLLYRRKQNV